MNTVRKTNTQLLKEVQNVVDEINNKKQEVEELLTTIDLLEKKYFDLIEEAKQNSQT